MAEKPLMVKAGPRSANQRYGFRLTADKKLEFNGTPKKVERIHKSERIRVARNDKGEREEVIEPVVIDVAAMVQRYVNAGYLEYVE